MSGLVTTSVLVAPERSLTNLQTKTVLVKMCGQRALAYVSRSFLNPWQLDYAEEPPAKRIE